MQAKRVVLVSNSLSSTLVFRRSLVKKLYQKDRLAFIVSTRDDSSFVLKGDDEYPCIFLVGKNIFELVRSICVAKSKATKANAFVFHGFTHMGNVMATLLWLFSGGKLVLSITGMGRAFSRTGPKYFFLRKLILAFYTIMQFFVRRVIVQNTEDFELLSKLYLPRLRTKILITNGSGIELDYFDIIKVKPRVVKPNSDGLNIGFFSRALPEKGVQDYYDLAKQYSEIPSFKFDHWGHVGVGSYSKEHIYSTACRSNVAFHGFVLDPRQHIMELDIVILPSAYREGLSRLCIEAMLAGKIVVARFTAGVGDHIQNGKNGFVYAEPSELQTSFEEAVNADRVRIGCAARAYAIKTFNVDDVDQVYWSAYGFPSIS